MVAVAQAVQPRQLAQDRVDKLVLMIQAQQSNPLLGQFLDLLEGMAEVERFHLEGCEPDVSKFAVIQGKAKAYTSLAKKLTQTRPGQSDAK